MSDPITIISEMRWRIANTTPMMAAVAAAHGLGDGRREKTPSPEHNLISSLLPTGRELTDNVGRLEVGVKVSFNAR